jgi:hypothetical protein
MGNLKEAFVESVESIEMGEDGMLDMQIAEPDYEELAYHDVTEPDQPEYVQQDTPPTEDVPWEKRYNDLRPKFTQVTQQNSDLRKRIDALERQANIEPAPQSPEQTGLAQVPEDLYDLMSDPAAFQTAVGKVAKEVIDEAMSLYVPPEMVAQWRVNSEIQQAMLNHEDFHDVLPHMETVYKRFPDADLTVEQAYELARFAIDGVRQQKGSQEDAPPATPDVTPETPAPQAPVLSREELIARSQRLQTAEGNANDDGFVVEEIVKTPRDAIMAAIRDMEDNS